MGGLMMEKDASSVSEHRNTDVVCSSDMDCSAQLVSEVTESSIICFGNLGASREAMGSALTKLASDCFAASLQSLRLHGIPCIPQAVLQQLSDRCPRLTSLELPADEQPCLEPLGSAERRHRELVQQRLSRPPGAWALQQLPGSLTELSLTECGSLHPSALVHLRGLSGLKRLSIRGLRVPKPPAGPTGQSLRRRCVAAAAAAAVAAAVAAAAPSSPNSAVAAAAATAMRTSADSSLLPTASSIASSHCSLSGGDDAMGLGGAVPGAVDGACSWVACGWPGRPGGAAASTAGGGGCPVAASLEHWSRLTRLEDMELLGQAGVDSGEPWDALLPAFVTSLESLTRLAFHPPALRDAAAGLAPLEHCASLRRLELGCTGPSPLDLPDAAWRVFAAAPSLEQLLLGHCDPRVSGSALASASAAVSTGTAGLVLAASALITADNLGWGSTAAARSGGGWGVDAAAGLAGGPWDWEAGRGGKPWLVDGVYDTGGGGGGGRGGSNAWLRTGGGGGGALGGQATTPAGSPKRLSGSVLGGTSGLGAFAAGDLAELDLPDTSSMEADWTWATAAATATSAAPPGTPTAPSTSATTTTPFRASGEGCEGSPATAFTTAAAAAASTAASGRTPRVDYAGGPSSATDPRDTSHGQPWKQQQQQQQQPPPSPGTAPAPPASAVDASVVGLEPGRQEEQRSQRVVAASGGRATGDDAALEVTHTLLDPLPQSGIPGEPGSDPGLPSAAFSSGWAEASPLPGLPPFATPHDAVSPRLRLDATSAATSAVDSGSCCTASGASSTVPSSSCSSSCAALGRMPGVSGCGGGGGSAGSGGGGGGMRLRPAASEDGGCSWCSSSATDDASGASLAPSAALPATEAATEVKGPVAATAGVASPPAVVDPFATASRSQPVHASVVAAEASGLRAGAGYGVGAGLCGTTDAATEGVKAASCDPELYSRPSKCSDSQASASGAEALGRGVGGGGGGSGGFLLSGGSGVVAGWGSSSSSRMTEAAIVAAALSAAAAYRAQYPQVSSSSGGGGVSARPDKNGPGGSGGGGGNATSMTAATVAAAWQATAAAAVQQQEQQGQDVGSGLGTTWGAPTPGGAAAGSSICTITEDGTATGTGRDGQAPDAAATAKEPASAAALSAGAIGSGSAGGGEESALDGSGTDARVPAGSSSTSWHSADGERGLPQSTHGSSSTAPPAVEEEVSHANPSIPAPKEKTESATTYSIKVGVKRYGQSPKGLTAPGPNLAMTLHRNTNNPHGAHVKQPAGRPSTGSGYGSARSAFVTWRPFSSLRRLSFLRLDDVSCMSLAGCWQLQGQLRCLSVTDAGGLGVAAVEALPKLTRLEQLSLLGLRHTFDDVFAAWPSLDHLRALELGMDRTASADLVVQEAATAAAADAVEPAAADAAAAAALTATRAEFTQAASPNDVAITEAQASAVRNAARKEPAGTGGDTRAGAGITRLGRLWELQDGLGEDGGELDGLAAEAAELWEGWHGDGAGGGAGGGGDAGSGGSGRGAQSGVVDHREAGDGGPGSSNAQSRQFSALSLRAPGAADGSSSGTSASETSAQGGSTRPDGLDPSGDNARPAGMVSPGTVDAAVTGSFGNLDDVHPPPSAMNDDDLDAAVAAVAAAGGFDSDIEPGVSGGGGGSVNGDGTSTDIAMYGSDSSRRSSLAASDVGSDAFGDACGGSNKSPVASASALAAATLGLEGWSRGGGDLSAGAGGGGRRTAGSSGAQETQLQSPPRGLRVSLPPPRRYQGSLHPPTRGQSDKRWLRLRPRYCASAAALGSAAGTTDHDGSPAMHVLAADGDEDEGIAVVIHGHTGADSPASTVATIGDPKTPTFWEWPSVSREGHASDGYLYGNVVDVSTTGAPYGIGVDGGDGGLGDIGTTGADVISLDRWDIDPGANAAVRWASPMAVETDRGSAGDGANTVRGCCNGGAAGADGFVDGRVHGGRQGVRVIKLMEKAAARGAAEKAQKEEVKPVELTDRGLQVLLRMLPRLKELHLHHLPHLTAATVEQVLSRPGLRALQVDGCRLLTPDCCELLAISALDLTAGGQDDTTGEGLRLVLAPA